MPKQTDLAAKAAELQEMIDNGNLKARIQVVSRFPVEEALRFIEECMEHDELPADLIRRMAESYFESKENGLNLILNKIHKRILSEIRSETGQDDAAIIKDLIANYGLKRIQEIKTALNPTDNDKDKDHSNNKS